MFLISPLLCFPLLLFFGVVRPVTLAHEALKGDDVVALRDTLVFFVCATLLVLPLLAVPFPLHLEACLFAILMLSFQPGLLEWAYRSHIAPSIARVCGLWPVPTLLSETEREETPLSTEMPSSSDEEEEEDPQAPQ